MAIPKAGPEPLVDLASFLEPFGELVFRSESRAAMERYATGLVSDLNRKTAADIGRALPGTNSQRLQEFLTNTDWDPREMDRLRVAQMLGRASVGAGVFVVDDTGIAKKGRLSVGVARQYSGTLGRVDNCQVLVTAHYVDRVFDWPVTARIYLHESWAEDEERRQKAHVPPEVRFQTKRAIALDLIDEGLGAGVEPRAVVTDAGYGHQAAFLDGLEERELPYVAGVNRDDHFRVAQEVAADRGDGPPPPYQGRGRPRKAPSLANRVEPKEAQDLLDALPEEAWQQIAWREGTKGPLVKQFARVRVFRTGLRGKHLESEGWLIGEHPLPNHTGDRKVYFAHGLDDLNFDDLVDLAHLRWVVERFYQDAKGELGLDDYEGRLWQGFHRHLALVMLAHSFLTLRQAYGPDVLGRGESDGESGCDPPADGKAVESSSPVSVRGFPPTG